MTFLVCRQGLRNFYVHHTERLFEIFNNNTRYDVLFLGSSRTHTTIHPGIIDSICKLNSFNAGVEGGNIYEFKLTLDGFLVNHASPEYVVLTLDLQSFNIKRRIFNYTQYFPFLDNPVITERLSESGHKTAVIKLLPFLAMTTYDDYTRGNILKGWAGKTEIPAGDYQYKGFLSNTAKELSAINQEPVKPTMKVTMSSEGLRILSEIAQTCKNRNIRLIFTYAPEYKKNLQNGFINREEFFKTMVKISREEQIPFLRHDELDLCQNPKLFANVGHVNRLGAEVYTRILGEELRSIIVVTRSAHNKK